MLRLGRILALGALLMATTVDGQSRKIIRVSPEVSQNLIVQQPLPVYPPNLLLRGVEGKVLVEILVDETGTPETILSY